jgi:hypothetical protein
LRRRSARRADAGAGGVRRLVRGTSGRIRRAGRGGAPRSRYAPSATGRGSSRMLRDLRLRRVSAWAALSLSCQRGSSQATGASKRASTAHACVLARVRASGRATAPDSSRALAAGRCRRSWLLRRRVDQVDVLLERVGRRVVAEPLLGPASRSSRRRRTPPARRAATRTCAGRGDRDPGNAGSFGGRAEDLRREVVTLQPGARPRRRRRRHRPTARVRSGSVPRPAQQARRERTPEARCSYRRELARNPPRQAVFARLFAPGTETRSAPRLRTHEGPVQTGPSEDGETRTRTGDTTIFRWP